MNDEKNNIKTHFSAFWTYTETNTISQFWF
jgi:hypothetical protein